MKTTAQSAFLKRHDAGRRFDEVPASRHFKEPPVVLGPARGGMLVAAEVAWKLRAPSRVEALAPIGGLTFWSHDKMPERFPEGL